MRFSAILVLLSAALAGAQGPRRAPGFSLPASNNQQIDLADYRGKVVVLDLMKTDCPHCGVFARVLEQVKNRYAGKVEVLAIAPTPDNTTTVAKFVQANKLTYPVLFDCGQVIFSYVRPSPLNPAIELPHSYVVDRNGFIVRDFVYGPATVEIFEGQRLFAELDAVLGTAPRKK